MRLATVHYWVICGLFQPAPVWSSSRSGIRRLRNAAHLHRSTVILIRARRVAALPDSADGFLTQGPFSRTRTVANIRAVVEAHLGFRQRERGLFADWFEDALAGSAAAAQSPPVHQRRTNEGFCQQVETRGAELPVMRVLWRCRGGGGFRGRHLKGAKPAASGGG